MVPFRFRHNQNSYIRWRCRVARRRSARLVLPLEAMSQKLLIIHSGRRIKSAVLEVQPLAVVLQIGKFVVGQEGDPQLHGHPDIRY